MFRDAPNIQPKRNLSQMVMKEARIRQLPSSRRWIKSSRISTALTFFVLISWIALSLMHDSLFLREALASSFIIGCSHLFNRDNFAKNVLN
ncbi:MAG: hypothetical protein WBV45_11985 [Lutimonas sp.]